MWIQEKDWATSALRRLSLTREVRTHWLLGVRHRVSGRLGREPWDAGCERRVRKGRRLWRPPLVSHQPPLTFLPDSREVVVRHNPEQVERRKFFKPQAKGERFKSQIEPLQKAPGEDVIEAG